MAHVHVDMDALAEAATVADADDHGHSHQHGGCGHSHGHGHGHGHGHSPGRPPQTTAANASSAQFQFQPRHQHPHDSHHTQQQHAVPAQELTPLEELFQCAKTNNLARFRELVANTPRGSEMVHQRDPMGHTLAHWMAQKGSAELLEFAHSVDAPMNLPSEDSVKLHPIHWSCSTGNLVALKTFVRLGVDVNTADATKQRTPLLIAAQNGFPLLVMYLIKNGADVTLVDIDEDSAIHWAAYKGATEIVSVFQYLGLSSDGPDRYGQTPLHLAAMRGELSTVQYLVEELDSDLDAPDLQGRTPLDLAKLKGYKRVANYLARQRFRNKWNVFSWWESSRAPYFYTLANIVLSHLLYVCVLMPAMPDMRCIYVPHLVWNVITWGFFCMTVRTSPGNITKEEVYAKEYSDVTEAMISGEENGNLRLERPLCHSCHVQRPLRSKHCRVCKTCIHQFDHHCPFVDNCVGRDNHVHFIAFVGFLSVNIVLLEYVLYLYWSFHGFRFWVLACMVYFGVMLLPVTHLFGFHVYLTAKNLTTNEVMNSHRYQYMRTEQGRYQNPFDKGVLKNLAERCLPAYVLSENNGDSNNGQTSTTRKLATVTTSQGEYMQVSDMSSAPALPVHSKQASKQEEEERMWMNVFGLGSRSAKLMVFVDKSAYAAGDLVRGKVVLCVFEDMIGDELVVQIQGKEKISWTELESNGGGRDGPRRKKRTKTNLFLNDEIVVFLFPRAFAKGNYEFPFLYQSHATLPGVFAMEKHHASDKIRDLHASLTYTVRARLDEGYVLDCWNMHARCNLVLHELPKIGIHYGASSYNGSFDAKTQSVKLLSLLSQGNCETSAFLDKSVYRSGETARIQCHVNNASQMHIQAVKVSLYQDVYLSLRREKRGEGCRSAHPVSRKVAAFDFAGVSAASQRHDNLVLALRSDDGRELAPSTNGALIKCAYRVHLQFDIRWCPDPCLDLPIVITSAATSTCASDFRSERMEATMVSGMH